MYTFAMCLSTIYPIMTPKMGQNEGKQDSGFKSETGSMGVNPHE